jgi:hypothetical protein
MSRLGALQLIAVIGVACGALLLPAGSKAQTDHATVEITVKRLNRLVYEKWDFKEALKLAKQLRAIKRIGPLHQEKASNINNLITDYSDCEQKPLKLYFRAEIDNTKQEPKELTPTLAQLYLRSYSYRREYNLTKLVTDYPRCRLAGFAQFLLAQHIASRRGSGWVERNEQESKELALKAYQQVIEEHPQATFPINSQAMQIKKGLPMAPIAQLNIARLHLAEPNPDPEKAIGALKKILKNHSEAKNYYGTNLGLVAYYKLLHLYRGDHNLPYPLRKNTEDKAQAKRIVGLLLTNYKNQQIELDGYRGQLHGDALTWLSELEQDTAKKIDYYLQILLRFPTQMSGSNQSCDVDSYGSQTLGRISRLPISDKEKEQLLWGIGHGQFNRQVRADALLRLAEFVDRKKEHQRALAMYELVQVRYAGVQIGLYQDDTADAMAKEAAKGIRARMELAE